MKLMTIIIINVYNFIDKKKEYLIIDLKNQDFKQNHGIVPKKLNQQINMKASKFFWINYMDSTKVTKINLRNQKFRIID